MYKITIDELKKIRKALSDANAHIKNRYGSGRETRERNVIKQNEKTIKFIDDKFLNISA